MYNVTSSKKLLFFDTATEVTMKTMNEKIWNGEYWGMNGALVESILTLPKNVWENGLLTALIERVSNFYSATGTAQKMRGKRKVWTLRYYVCAALTFLFWVKAYVLLAAYPHKITSPQYDVMGTVGAKIGFKKIAKNFLLDAIRFTPASAPLHERALPICQFLLLDFKGTHNGESLYTILFNYLEVPSDMWPDKNQLGRVLRATIKYERKTGKNYSAAHNQSKLEKLELDKDQRVKCGLEK